MCILMPMLPSEPLERADESLQVVLARTEGGAVCGGYNPKGWIGLGEDRDAIAAFLFTWPDGNTSKRPIKLQKVHLFPRMKCNMSVVCLVAAQFWSQMMNSTGHDAAMLSTLQDSIEPHY